MKEARQDKQEYVADDTPEGVVHNYALAVFNEDYEKAYAYLAESKNKPTYNEFRQAFFNHYVSPENAGLELGETKIAGEEAYVTVYLIYNPSDPFSSSYRNTDTAQLERQNGNLRSWENQLADVRSNMKYDFWALILSILVSLLMVIIIIWIVGAIIELLNLNVDIATNINNLRALKEKEQAKE